MHNTTYSVCFTIKLVKLMGKIFQILVFTTMHFCKLNQKNTSRFPRTANVACRH